MQNSNEKENAKTGAAWQTLPFATSFLIKGKKGKDLP